MNQPSRCTRSFSTSLNVAATSSGTSPNGMNPIVAAFTCTPMTWSGSTRPRSGATNAPKSPPWAPYFS